MMKGSVAQPLPRPEDPEPIIDLVIRRMRARCPFFAGKVAGAAQALLWAEARAMNAPFVYVVPAGMRVTGQAGDNFRPREFWLINHYQIIVTLNSFADDRNQKAAEQFERMRDSILFGLIYWRPNQHLQPVRLEGIVPGDQNREYSEWLVSVSIPEQWSGQCTETGFTAADLALLQQQNPGLTAEELTRQYDLEDMISASGGQVGRLHNHPPHVTLGLDVGQIPPKHGAKTVTFIAQETTPQCPPYT